MADPPVVDLNADVGEGAGDPAGDLELLAFVTSVNVACGGHAGDPETMRVICSAAATSSVAVGAHPGYPDRERFGRRETGASPAEIAEVVSSQVSGLVAIAEGAGVRVDHVKPHGALYHRCWFDREAAEAVVEAIARISPGSAVMAPPGSQLELAAVELGLEAIAEGFVDRAYSREGTLLPRGDDGATLAHSEAVQQALALAGGRGPAGGAVRSLCIHGDGDRPTELARLVVEALGAAGIGVRGYR